MPNLLRYRELAVVHYSGIPCASHLRHARQSLNLGNKSENTVYAACRYENRMDVCVS